MSDVLDLDVITAETYFTEDHWMVRYHDYMPGGRKRTDEHARTLALSDFLSLSHSDFHDVSTTWVHNKLYFRTSGSETLTVEKLTTLMATKIKMDGRLWVFSSIGCDSATVSYPYEEPYSASFMEIWWVPAEQ